jgi:hypothetical protein
MQILKGGYMPGLINYSNIQGNTKAAKVSHTHRGHSKTRVLLSGFGEKTGELNKFAIGVLDQKNTTPADTSELDSTKGFLGRGGTLWLKMHSETSDENQVMWVKVSRHELCTRLDIDMNELLEAESKGVDSQTEFVSGKIEGLQLLQSSQEAEISPLAVRTSTAPPVDKDAKIKEKGMNLTEVTKLLKGLAGECKKPHDKGLFREPGMKSRIDNYILSDSKEIEMPTSNDAVGVLKQFVMHPEVYARYEETCKQYQQSPDQLSEEEQEFVETFIEVMVDHCRNGSRQDSGVPQSWAEQNGGIEVFGRAAPLFFNMFGKGNLVGVIRDQLPDAK